MKHLVLIIHAGSKQSTTDLLRSLDEVDDFTFTDIEGHGSQSDNDPELSNRDRVVGYIPQLRVDMILDDSKVEPVLAAFQKNKSSSQSNSKQNLYWVTDVKEQGRF